MVKYTQLKEFEREHIFKGIMGGLSQREVAHQLSRSASTISREVARNRDETGYLYARQAQERTDRRKARHGSKISRNPAQREYIIQKLACGWSPNATAGRWNRENPKLRMSAESIYQFIYAPQNKELALWRHLPRAKRQRQQQGTRKHRNVAGITHRVSIHDRPEEVNKRKTAGHYEADLMFNSGSQSANVLTIVERKSRMVALVKHESKHSSPIIQSLKKYIKSTAKSCTFDNGKEFALHHQLNIPTFFCDLGKPWQKGSVENMNGLVRRYLPFNLDHHSITQERLDHIALIINHTPRKILNFLTPHEVFMKNNLQESRVKTALPAAEVFYQNFNTVALHS